MYTRLVFSGYSCLKTQMESLYNIADFNTKQVECILDAGHGWGFIKYGYWRHWYSVCVGVESLSPSVRLKTR